MNAVLKQIWIAICDYLLLIIARKRYTLEPSLHSISNSIGQILFKRGNIRDIFNQPAFSFYVPDGELVSILIYGIIFPESNNVLLFFITCIYIQLKICIYLNM